MRQTYLWEIKDIRSQNRTKHVTYTWTLVPGRGDNGLAGIVLGSLFAHCNVTNLYL